MNKKIRQAVTGQLISMLYNDIINEYGGESFEGWCADGEVFEDLTEEEIEKANALVKEITPLVDNITYNYLFVDACED